MVQSVNEIQSSYQIPITDEGISLWCFRSQSSIGRLTVISIDIVVCYYLCVVDALIGFVVEERRTPTLMDS